MAPLTQREQAPQADRREPQALLSDFAGVTSLLQRQAEIVIGENRLGIWAAPLVKGSR